MDDLVIAMLDALVARLRRAHARVVDTGDRGTTLMELIVGMTIMVIAGSIFTGAVVSLYKTTNEAQAVTNSSAQNNQAYQALERTVREAAAISVPGQSTGATTTGNWYVELRNTTTGTEVCTQLQVNIATKQLRRRTWTVAPLTAASDWVTIASDLANASAPAGKTQPFTLADKPKTGDGVLETSRETAQHQKLVVYIESTSGPANQRATSRSRFALTALNSTVPVATGSICQQYGRP